MLNGLYIYIHTHHIYIVHICSSFLLVQLGWWTWPDSPFWLDWDSAAGTSLVQTELSIFPNWPYWRAYTLLKRLSVLLFITLFLCARRWWVSWRLTCFQGYLEPGNLHRSISYLNDNHKHVPCKSIVWTHLVFKSLFFKFYFKFWPFPLL